jgi:Major Facilitator Superfamily
MSLSLFTSLASAVAPDFAVLLVASVLHGLFGGMLFVVMVPPLLTTFGSAKLNLTATVLVPSLFGASTLGPLIGGLVATSQLWRSIFAAEVLLAAVAIVLGLMTLQRGVPQPTSDPPDVPALVMAAVGTAAIFVGAGQLAIRPWTAPQAFIPVSVGVAAFVAMFVIEGIRANPLVPVRRLVTSLAFVGAIGSITASACFAATQTGLLLALQRLAGLTARETGLTLWPEFIAALIAGIIFGRLVTTRFIVMSSLCGLVVIVITDAAAWTHMSGTPAFAGVLAFVASLGAGLAVTPALFLAMLSFERSLVSRAIALLNVLRLTGGFISGPGVEHTIGNGGETYLERVAGIPHQLADAASRAFLVDGTSDTIPRSLLQQALQAGLHAAAGTVVIIGCAGIIAIAIVLIVGRVRFRAPDLRALDEGKPALT